MAGPPSTDSAILLQAHFGLPVYHAQKFAGRGVEMDDLIQEARLAMLRGAQRWRAGRGCSLAAWLTICIKGRLRQVVRDEARRHARKPRRLSQDIADRRKTPDLAVEQADLVRWVQRHFACNQL